MRVNIPFVISIGSAVLAQLTLVTNRQTDKPRYSDNNRPHLVLRIAIDAAEYCDRINQSINQGFFIVA